MLTAAKHSAESTGRTFSTLANKSSLSYADKLSRLMPCAASFSRIGRSALPMSSKATVTNLVDVLRSWGDRDDETLSIAAKRILQLPKRLSDLNMKVDNIKIDEVLTNPITQATSVRNLSLHFSNHLPHVTIYDPHNTEHHSLSKRIVTYAITNLDDHKVANVVRVSFPVSGAITKGGIRVLPYEGPGNETSHSMIELEEGAAQLAQGMKEKISCVGLDQLTDNGLGFKLSGGKTEVSMPFHWEGLEAKQALFAAKGLIAATTLPLGIYDTPAPDMRSGPAEMDAYCQALKEAGVKHPGFWITGKGTQGAHPLRPQATGEGVAEILRQTLKMEGAPFSIHEAKIAVQGAGNVGEYTMKSLVENDGAKIVVMSDVGGALSLETGFNQSNLSDAMKVIKGQLSLFDFNARHHTDAKLYDHDNIWKLGANTFIPAANKNSVDLQALMLASQTTPVVIICGANNALSEETIHQLDSASFPHGVYIVPPEIANPGGVAGSALEMDSSRLGIDWHSPVGKERQTSDKQALQNMMKNMFKKIMGTHISAVEKGRGYVARNTFVEASSKEPLVTNPSLKKPDYLALDLSSLT